MNKLLISLATVAMLCGCAVVPVQSHNSPVYVEPQIVAYPQYESAYIWDPLALSYFFVYGGQRRYMDRGWAYRSHGFPHANFVPHNNFQPHGGFGGPGNFRHR